MDFKKIQHIHMVGVGGIGMSALAQLFLQKGKSVSGSDRSSSNTTSLVESKGVLFSLGDEEKNIPNSTDLLVYSDAVPEDSKERVGAKSRGIPELSYFEALGCATRDMYTIAVAGTHGKTTTSAILTKILSDVGKSPTAVVGSIMKDFGSNFVSGDSELFVVEACEYKEHLLKLNPDILVITNIDLDHTDYFEDLTHMQQVFHTAALKIPPKGFLVTDPSNKNIAPILKGLRCQVVDYTEQKVQETDSLPGEFNIMNAQAAFAAARAYTIDLSDKQIQASVDSFSGTWRRFEFKGRTSSGALVYDDYAHHPTAIKSTIQMVRKIFRDKKITIIFHPHLYSRTKYFFDEFANALSLADKVGILPIYAAREEKDFEVSSEKLVDKLLKLGTTSLFLPSFEAAAVVVEKSSKEDIVITMGAGDVYKVSDKMVI